VVETIVAVAGVDSVTVHDLRQAGWRVRLLTPSADLDEMGALSPDAVFIDLGSIEGSERVLEIIESAVGIEETPVLIAIDIAGLRRLSTHRRVSDFVITPARPEELSARLRRLLRTRTGSADEDGLWTAGPLTIDAKRFEASLAGVPLEFAYQEFQLLRFFVANPDQAFSRDQLLARVWGWDYFGGPRTVDIHVRRVRAKLGEACSGWLETVRNVGYRWSPPSAHEGLAGAPARVSPRRTFGESHE